MAVPRPDLDTIRKQAAEPCGHGGERIACRVCAAEAKADGVDAAQLWAMLRASADCDRRFPRRYLDAEADHPEVIGWAETFLGNPAESPSLLIVGPTGVGKTYQAYGALRFAVTAPKPATWESTTFADFTAALRPGGKDPEGSLTRYRSVSLLLIDDLGAAKQSEWVEETTYRLINARYEAMRPAIFTTNLPLADLRAGLGDRIASRLVETCTLVVMEGGDRRRQKNPRAKDITDVD